MLVKKTASGGAIRFPENPEEAQKCNMLLRGDIKQFAEKHDFWEIVAALEECDDDCLWSILDAYEREYYTPIDERLRISRSASIDECALVVCRTEIALTIQEFVHAREPIMLVLARV
jgi:hypothetical protein